MNMDNTAETKYAAAIGRDRPRHGTCDEFSLRHPRMPLGQRAKIFSPFSALRGFEEAIEEKLERYVEKRALTEEEQAEIDRCLIGLTERTRSRRLAREAPVRATVLYYVPCADENHEAYGCRGRYLCLTDRVWQVDAVRRVLLIGETAIDFADIAALAMAADEEES